jgi:hypothetical protein
MKGADPDWIIDGIRNTLLEAFDQINDIDGPNWEHMARAVYEQHIAPVAVQALAHDNERNHDD